MLVVSSFVDEIFLRAMQDLRNQPVEVVGQILAALGEELTPSQSQELRDWLAHNSVSKYGHHTYDKEDFGLTDSKLSQVGVFQEYCAFFSVAGC